MYDLFDILGFFNFTLCLCFTGHSLFFCCKGKKQIVQILNFSFLFNILCLNIRSFMCLIWRSKSSPGPCCNLSHSPHLPRTSGHMNRKRIKTLQQAIYSNLTSISVLEAWILKTQLWRNVIYKLVWFLPIYIHTNQRN